MKKIASLLLGVSLLAACAPSDRRIAPSGDLVANASVALENGRIAERFEAADYILIGEKHDNPEHHDIQLALLQALVKPGDVVVFEMLNREQQPAIDRFLSGALPYAELEKALDWKASGWPDWQHYGPLFGAAKDGGARIYYGSFPKKELRSKMSLADDHFAPLPAKLHDDLDLQIKSSHCDLLPENMIRPMSNIQIAKDKKLAQELVENRQDGRAFLIAGNGHIRKDRAVPYYLAQLDKEATVQVLALIEERNTDALEDPFPLYDTLWLTSSTPEKDYCADLRKKFGKTS